jgi:hypothetical protein
MKFGNIETSSFKDNGRRVAVATQQTGPDTKVRALKDRHPLKFAKGPVEIVTLTAIAGNYINMDLANPKIVTARTALGALRQATKAV